MGLLTLLSSAIDGVATDSVACNVNGVATATASGLSGSVSKIGDKSGLGLTSLIPWARRLRLQKQKNARIRAAMTTTGITTAMATIAPVERELCLAFIFLIQPSGIVFNTNLRTLN